MATYYDGAAIGLVCGLLLGILFGRHVWPWMAPSDANHTGKGH